MVQALPPVFLVGAAAFLLLFTVTLQASCPFKSWGSTDANGTLWRIHETARQQQQQQPQQQTKGGSANNLTTHLHDQADT